MKVIKKSNRGRKSGSFSFRRVKLIDLLAVFNVVPKNKISDSTSVIVAEKWAATINIKGQQVSSDLAEINGKNIIGSGVKVILTEF